MSLERGQRIGVYEIVSWIGAGGMGEVYRARDTRLGRDVAVKVLPAEALADDSRRRRFVREARAASALNHPNIVTIHEIESHDGQDFIVMEYLPGRTLEALIRAGLSLGETLRISIPIASALAHAHGSGIVHRDLKPANVIVTPEGSVKVLDFGLAKLAAPATASEASDTLTGDPRAIAESTAGLIAGTPGYMSPEQATGGAVDARSDIFAFGSLLYEMATGRRAFAGASRAETLAAVVRDQPKAPRELQPQLPRELERVILRCLRKEPARRFHHMGDVKVELEDLLEEWDSGRTTPEPAFRAPRRTAAGVAAGLVLAVAAAAAVLISRREGPPPVAPRVVPLTATSGHEGWPTFSPDGTQVAFMWDGEAAEGGARSGVNIWLKLIGSSETRRVTSGAGLDCCPSWSPDGRQIAFTRLSAPDGRFQVRVQTGTIHLVSPLGGMERKLSDFAAADSTLAWSPDARWLVAGSRRRPGDESPGGGALQRVSLDTGEARPITAPAYPAYDTFPALSPDGRRLAYASCGFWWLPPCDVEIVEVTQDLVARSPPRHLVRLSERVQGIAWARDGGSVLYSVMPNNLYLSRLWRVDAAGRRPPERIELAPGGSVAATVSPAGERLAFTLERSAYSSISRFESGLPPRPVMASPGGDNAPSFAPDGRRIAFISARGGESTEVWLADPDGANAQQLTRGPGTHQGTPRFSPDGRRVVFESRGLDGFADLWTIDVAGGQPRRVTDCRYHAGRASYSADGRLLYFREDRADGRDIMRVPEAGGTPERVTRDGGFFARPSTDGRWLYYTKTDPTSALYRMALPNGAEEQVADCVQSVSLDAGPAGMYYARCAPQGEGAPLVRLDAEGREHPLGRLPSAMSIVLALGVSPDAKTVLFASVAPRLADLYLIEGFR